MNWITASCIWTKTATSILRCSFLKEGWPDHRLGFGRTFGKSKSKVETLIIEAPLVQALSAVTNNVNFSSIPVDRTGPLASHFNLLQHKGMVIQLILLTGLGTYALVDYVMLTNYLVVGDMPAWRLFLVHCWQALWAFVWVKVRHDQSGSGSQRS